MDDRLQDWINGLAGHSGLADALMKLMARDFVFLAVPFVLVLWFWPVAEANRAFNQRLAAATALGGVLALVLAAGVGQVVSQTRPFVVDSATRLLIPHAADNGFPSDHTSFAFGVAGVIVWWKRGLGVVLLVFAAVEGFSRVYVGVHWPSDVLAGAAVGLVAGGAAALSVPLWVEPQRWASRILPPLLLSPP